ncbi:MAG: ribose 5-phosphate isomerase B [Chloroflexi bacterium]|nr:ribose 5-phosphate isomerase B [Chloroflexota bacterium]
MRVAIGVDHAGFPLKAGVIAALREAGHQVLDLGTRSTAPVDYPDYARAVGLAILNGEADRGVVICGSGVGASVAASKLPGIRAATCHDTYSAHQGVEHDDLNVLTLGCRVVGEALAIELVQTFLRATFTGEERHVRRLGKIHAIEREGCGLLREKK